jgi:hypothetical protein
VLHRLKSGVPFLGATVTTWSLLGVLGTTAMARVVGDRSDLKAANRVRLSPSRCSDGFWCESRLAPSSLSEPCLAGRLELPLSIVTIRSSRAVLYFGAFHRMHFLFQHGSGASGALRARSGGKEVSTGKRYGRDGTWSLEPLLIIGVFLHHCHFLRGSLAPSLLGSSAVH